MSSYGNIANTRTVNLPYLPIEGVTSTGLKVTLVKYRECYEKDLYRIVKQIIDDGLTYPFESFDTVQEFRAYYLSHECFVCLDDSGRVVGSFYVKPNFPGRSNHICNTGFAVDECYRRQGIASFMCGHYLQIARDLGYEGSMFNLVYVTNVGSIKLWDKFGFEVIGRLPRAGRLKNQGYVDALMYYYDLTKIPKRIS